MIYIKADNGASLSINGEAEPIATGETHTFSNEVCAQTLEDGRSYKDHIVNNPDKVTLNLHVGNAVGGFELAMAYMTLRDICDERALVTIHTSLEIYSSMAIESVSVPVQAPYKGRADITLELVKVDLVGEGERTYVWHDAPPARTPGQDKDMVLIYDSKPDSEPEIEEEDVPEIPIIPIPASDSPEKQQEELTLRQKIIDALKSLPGKAKAAALETFAAIKSNPFEFANAVMDSVRNGFPNGNLMGFLPQGCRDIASQATGVWLQAQITYNSLTDCFNVLFKSSDNRTKYAGALLPGCNSIKGLDLKDDYGNAYPLAGAFLLTMEERAEATPNAFVKNEETGAAPCYILLFAEKEEARKYERLVLNTEDAPLNYNFEDLDYVKL